MKKIALSIILFFVAPIFVCGAELTFHQADSLAWHYCRQTIISYANAVERDWESGVLKSGEYKMPFVYTINGESTEQGYPLYISLHGGGGTTAEVNDEQWENQKRLYGDVEGVYFVPRAPVDEWDMWHQGYMENFLMQIVTYSISRFNVDPRRVYLLGYSAGGDGVYNLACRLSDRFAAAAMMAGHPGDAQIENLRNLPFGIYVGAEDTDYNRAGLAVEWLREFERLNEADPAGFQYSVNIYADKGHWMDGADSVAIGWLAQYRRLSATRRVIWIQDDILNTRKYNLEVSNPKQGFRVEESIDYENNTIYINSEYYDEVTIWLDDYLVDLDKQVVVIFNGREVFNGMVRRELQNIRDSIEYRLDPEYVYWGKIIVGNPI